MGNMDIIKEGSKTQEDDEDDVPDLVGTNFEEASKKQWALSLTKQASEEAYSVLSRYWSKANQLNSSQNIWKYLPYIDIY